MNAEPFLKNVARALAEAKLEAVMVGNAGAALHGAPVTTLDIDFMFRDTPVNRQKLKKVARGLKATVFRPYYPTSQLYRLIRDDGLQVDFLAQLHGVRSFASLRSRANLIQFGLHSVLVASLSDIIKSKEEADRPQDRASLSILKRTLQETEREQAKQEKNTKKATDKKTKASRS